MQNLFMSAFAALRTAARSARPPRSSWPAASSGMPSVALPFRSLAFRPYSTEEKPAEQAPKSEETPQNSSALESENDDPSAQSDEQKIIAAKDAEILDLTVRRVFSICLVTR